jgi:hypothetical protein
MMTETGQMLISGAIWIVGILITVYIDERFEDKSPALVGYLVGLLVASIAYAIKN